MASMLVSPIMGPVMAATFGSVVNDRRLIRVGERRGIERLRREEGRGQDRCKMTDGSSRRGQERPRGALEGGRA